LVEDYYEEFERVYDDRYQQQYGFWRPVIGEVLRKYLQCGDLITPGLHHDKPHRKLLIDPVGGGNNGLA
jgi:hypothetical protein